MWRGNVDKITVLIADDHMLFREGTRSLLEQEPDIEVVGEAGDGEEAIRLVKQLHPHVALMDIAMSKVNGIEATRQIKTNQSATAVLALTAYDNEQYILALLEAGAAGYLLKNVGRRELVSAIRSVYAGESVLHPEIAKKIFHSLVTKGKEAFEPSMAEKLSEREIEILKLAAKGLNNQDIGDKLFLSRRTVQAHLSNIFSKMNVGSRTEATLQALKIGLLTFDDIG
jgi:NarL family two-component system response regulator LiaR